MKTIKALKARLLQARKEKDLTARAVLSTMIADLEYAQRAGTVVDASVITSKIVNGINTAKDNAKLATTKLAEFKFHDEAGFLETLLPKMLTGAEILEIFVKEKPANMKEAMGIMKQSYAGVYDGRTTSTAAKGYFHG